MRRRAQGFALALLFFPRPALGLCFFVRSRRVEFSENGTLFVCPSADLAVWGFFQPGVNNRPYPLQFLPVVLFQRKSRPARHLIKILIDARAQFLKARLLPIICKPFRFQHFRLILYRRTAPGISGISGRGRSPFRPLKWCSRLVWYKYTRAAALFGFYGLHYYHLFNLPVHAAYNAPRAVLINFWVERIDVRRELSKGA